MSSDASIPHLKNVTQHIFKLSAHAGATLPYFPMSGIVLKKSLRGWGDKDVLHQLSPDLATRFTNPMVLGLV